ncbi:hypothetical protein P7K49_021941 [Saguinus oedipus]|uniref:Uncharacterized protein n=1 Tax=Saguinus oedipus TaxID=9490 RepID=A0ABQ9UU05_SAGOE|nr:hypothetical protein P7K49_021941 [Saguinus oedipus]
MEADLQAKRKDGALVSLALAMGATSPSSLAEGLEHGQLYRLDPSTSSPPRCPFLSLYTQTHAAPTSAHSSHQAGPDSGPPMLSSPSPVRAPAGSAPPPQREGHCMAASRQGMLPLGVLAPSSLPGTAGSWRT